jgi:hypothetical protein
MVNELTKHLQVLFLQWVNDQTGPALPIMMTLGPKCQDSFDQVSATNLGSERRK